LTGLQKWKGMKAWSTFPAQILNNNNSILCKKPILLLS
jgi:hypothetical protein